RATGVCTEALAGWHPEHELAPGGASAAVPTTGKLSHSSNANPGIEPTWPPQARRLSTAPASARPQILVHQRQRAHPLAGGGEDRVQHRRRRDRDRRLADAAPEIAGRHDDDLDLGHLVDAHHVVAIEIGLLDRAATDRAF